MTVRHSSYNRPLKHPESKVGCIGRVPSLRITGRRDALAPSTMTFSLRSLPYSSCSQPSELGYVELKDLSRLLCFKKGVSDSALPNSTAPTISSKVKPAFAELLNSRNR